MKMATLTIRNLPDEVRELLRVQAAKHSRSMEAEARDLITVAVTRRRQTGAELFRDINARFAEIGGVDLELPEREPLDAPRVNFDHPDYDPA